MKDLRTTSGLVDAAAVLADDLMLDAVRSGARGTDDPDPLVRLLAAWRTARRRPRTRGRRFGLGCR